MLNVRYATRDDVETLIRLRRDFNDTWHPHTEADQADFAARFRRFLDTRWDSGEFVGILGFVGTDVASGAFLLIHDYPANCVIRHGRLGTLINVYTYPAFRRRGYGQQIVAAAVERGRELGLDAIDLNATDMGRGVYQQVGFALRDEAAMRLDLASTAAMA